MKPQKYFTLSENDLRMIASQSFSMGARFIQKDTTTCDEFTSALDQAFNEAETAVLEKAEKAQNINRIFQECNL